MMNRLLLSIILFTAAIAAVNNTVIAQPQNNRLDSLKREYSYKICREYLNIKPIRTYKIQGSSYTLKEPIIPIAEIFPKYFTSIDTCKSIIFPDYYFFSMRYGCPLYTTSAPGHISDTLTACRNHLVTAIRQIYDIYVSNPEYMIVVDSILTKSIDYLNGVHRLKQIEQDIRSRSIKYEMVTENILQGTKYADIRTGNTPIPKQSAIFHSSRVGRQTIYPDGALPGKSARMIATDPLLPIGFVEQWYSSSYLSDYVNELRQANLASLRVILDDHIRRGVPIDISWIPEQTLAEIEATKPVRQLKKQIKALEKQQKQ